MRSRQHPIRAAANTSYQSNATSGRPIISAKRRTACSRLSNPGSSGSAVMRQTGSRDLKIWLPDGLNYAGQASLRSRQERLADSLRQIYAALDEDQRLLLEYKFFEPYFYAMDIPDWGTSVLHCQALGEQAQVVLDTGHHAPGTNIEFIVMQLLRQNRLGAFDFNSRFYADDDLVVGSADPFQLFRILNEIVAGDAHRPDPGPNGHAINFMLDQCHNIEEKIPGQIRSVLNVEQALAKALLVDRDALVVRAGGGSRSHASCEWLCGSDAPAT